MDVGSHVRVVDPGPEAYENWSLNGPNTFLVNQEGTIEAMVLNDQFEQVWRVKLTSGEVHLLYEFELEEIPEISGAVMIGYGYTDEDGAEHQVRITKEEVEAMDRPEWWDDADSIRMMLFEVEVEGGSFNKRFAPFFTKIGEVYEHLAKLEE